jgi:glycogen debranching enzyme
MTGLFEASTFFDLHRLPELFCGFPARVGEGPTLYPIACSPQAWAAAAVFMLLGSCLGMQIRGREDLITFRCPSLPRFMETLRIVALRTGPSSSVDLYLDRHPHDVGVSVVARRGPVRIVVER